MQSNQIGNQIKLYYSSKILSFLRLFLLLFFLVIRKLSFEKSAPDAFLNLNIVSNSISRLELERILDNFWKTFREQIWKFFDKKLEKFFGRANMEAEQRRLFLKRKEENSMNRTTNLGAEQRRFILKRNKHNFTEAEERKSSRRR